MKNGISVPNFGPFADPEVTVGLAVLAEEIGWDGFFLWDHIVIADAVPVADPWVLLGAIAGATEKVTLGPMVTPLPRRRPWVLARQTVTVDHLSAGRLVLGVGIGFPPIQEFGTFEEPTHERIRADMLDEALEIVSGMWSGESFEYRGQHYSVTRPTIFAPRPTHGRIPIWVAGTWPVRRPLRRAARFAGVFPIKADYSDWEPSEVAELSRLMTEYRGDIKEFDIVVGGSFRSGRERARHYEEAGATWYLSSPAQDDTVDELRAIIREGPAQPLS